MQFYSASHKVGQLYNQSGYRTFESLKGYKEAVSIGERTQKTYTLFLTNSGETHPLCRIVQAVKVDVLSYLAF